MLFSNFTTAQHNITPKSGRITCTDQEKTRIPARETATEHRLEPPPKQHTRRIHRNHCTFTPPLVATPLRCHPPSEGQANGEGTKGGRRGADQGSPKTMISPSMLMEPPLKAHPGSHVPPSNAVQGEETSQGNGGRVGTPTRHNI